MAPTNKNRELWREAIRTTLAHRAGDDLGAPAVAEATVGAWRQMAALLAPVLGARGVDVTFRRALSLTSKVFPWLALEAQGDSAALLVSLKATLAGQEADVAAETACALLVTFLELLTTLLGESMTEHLVSPVWAPPLSPSAQESES